MRTNNKRGAPTGGRFPTNSQKVLSKKRGVVCWSVRRHVGRTDPIRDPAIKTMMDRCVSRSDPAIGAYDVSGGGGLCPGNNRPEAERCPRCTSSRTAYNTYTSIDESSIMWTCATSTTARKGPIARASPSSAPWPPGLRRSGRLYVSPCGASTSTSSAAIFVITQTRILWCAIIPSPVGKVILARSTRDTGTVTG